MSLESCPELEQQCGWPYALPLRVEQGMGKAVRIGRDGSLRGAVPIVAARLADVPGLRAWTLEGRDIA